MAKRKKSYGFGIRLETDGELRLWGNFPPFVGAVALVILLAQVAEIAGLELSAVLEFIKTVIETLL